MIPSLLLTKKIINSDRASFNRSIGQLPYYAYVPIQNAKPLPPRTSSIPLAIDTVSNPPSPTIKNPRLDSIHAYIHTATVLPHPAYLPASFFIHPVRHSTRGVEAFLKKTAIAYGRDPSKKVKFWWYAIAVFFKNASTPRVPE